MAKDDAYYFVCRYRIGDSVDPEILAKGDYPKEKVVPVLVEVTNIKSAFTEFPYSYLELACSNRITYKASRERNVTHMDMQAIYDAVNIDLGQTKSFVVRYIIPLEATPIKLEYNGLYPEDCVAFDMDDPETCE
jgi:hypothetical protein